MALLELLYTEVLKPPPLRRAANTAIRWVLPQTVKVGNAVICINPRDPVVSGALTFRVYERAEIDFFCSMLRTDMTVIDVGANVGLYTALVLAHPGFSGTVVALEPDSESCLYLRRTIDRNLQDHPQCRVIVCDVAASDRKGIVSFYKNAQNKGDNRLYADPLLDKAGDVASDTLDEIAAKHAVSSVDMIKIDVQGAEARAIAGAQALLRSSTDCVLMTEFWPYGLQRSGSDAQAYLRILHENGFTLFVLERDGSLRLAESARKLISRAQGRKYLNLVGLKGRYLRRCAG